MKYVYAALLLHASEKPVNEENLKKVLSAVGVQVDAARAKALTASLSEIKIDDVLKSASTMAVGPAGPAEPGKKKEEKKPEDEKKKEEEALAGLGALFG